MPNLGDTVAFGLTGYDRSDFEKKIAKPYEWRKGKLQRCGIPGLFWAGSGLMSTVADLAVYSVAIDEKDFLSAESWNKVFTPAISEKGKTFPLWHRLVYQILQGHQSSLAHRPLGRLLSVVCKNSGKGFGLHNPGQLS